MIFINSFVILFEEDECDFKIFFLDLDYVEEMWRMFRKVNGRFIFIIFVWIGWFILLKVKECFIGFYYIGFCFCLFDFEIIEFFKCFCFWFVMVIVDVWIFGGWGDIGIFIDVYFVVEEIKDDGIVI